MLKASRANLKIFRNVLFFNCYYFIYNICSAIKALQQRGITKYTWLNVIKNSMNNHNNQTIHVNAISIDMYWLLTSIFMNPTQFELLRVDRTLPTVFYSVRLQGMAADAVKFLYIAPPSPRKGESFLFSFSETRKTFQIIMQRITSFLCLVNGKLCANTSEIRELVCTQF